jgi:hypothetical protein
MTDIQDRASSYYTGTCEMVRHLCSALGADALKSIGGLTGQYRVLQSVQNMLQHSLTQRVECNLQCFRSETQLCESSSLSHFNADPDPAPHQSATTGVQTLHGFIFNLHAAIVSIHGPPKLHLEPPHCSHKVQEMWSPQLMNFDFDADPDFDFDANPDNLVPYFF